MIVGGAVSCSSHMDLFEARRFDRRDKLALKEKEEQLGEYLPL